MTGITLMVLLIHAWIIAHTSSQWRRIGSVGHGRSHPLLLLSPVAEPDANHFLFQLKRIGQRGDLLSRRLGLFVEMLFQRPLDAHLDRCPLLPLASLSRNLVDGRRRSGGRIGLFQPLLQQRLQLAHVFKAELQRFEPADCRLREDVAVQSSQSQSDIRLGETQLDPALFKLFGEGFQVVRCRVLFFAGVATKIASGARMGPVVEVMVAVRVVIQVLVGIVRIVRMDRTADLTLSAPHSAAVVGGWMVLVVVLRVLQLALHSVHRRVVWMLDRRSSAGRHVGRRNRDGWMPARMMRRAAHASVLASAASTDSTAVVLDQVSGLRFDILMVRMQGSVSVNRMHGGPMVSRSRI